MIKEKKLEHIDLLIELLKRNVKKIDSRLSLLNKSPAICYELKTEEKKKALINNKSKYIIFSLVTVFVLLFFYSLSTINFSFNIPKIQNPFDGDAIEEYDCVNF